MSDMPGSAGDGFEWWRHSRPMEEAEEKDELEGCVDENGALGMTGFTGNVDLWNLSSTSQENLEEAGLLEELADYEKLLAGDKPDFDLGEIQDLECMGATGTGSPRPEDDGRPEDQGTASYWHSPRDQQLVLSEDNLQQDVPEKQEGSWDVNSEAEVDPELSYEGLYGSEFSPSPEALKDPLALYQCSKSYSFTSEGGEEELSEDSNLSPSPSRPSPECSPLKIDSFDTQSPCGNSQELPEETERTSSSERSPGSPRISSPASSSPWSHSPMGHLSKEDLQDSPGIDAETFPEHTWVESLRQPARAVLERGAGSARPSQSSPPAKPQKGLPNSSQEAEMPNLPRQPGRARAPKAGVPHGLPSKFSRQSRSLSPQVRRSWQRAGGTSPQESVQAGHLSPATGDASQYGRRQLNYPLPDLSKVAPRVKFPRDPQSYHPPRGRTPPCRTKDPSKPVVFKSPAEIVREVLMSSGEGSPVKAAAPALSVIPEELKSPRQATELVHQLQEDYHKLLTKYAEAENTIDRLRLGAKVHLYVDPPKPSQGAQVGAISQPSKVITFSIPQVRAAEVTGRPGPATDSVSGLSGQETVKTSLPSCAATASPGADGSSPTRKASSGDGSMQNLAAQARQLCVQVESLGELIRMGKLPPEYQREGLVRLKVAQDALEKAYLKARDEHRQLQNHQGPVRVLEDFDPDRALEGELFQLEMHLEELRERVQQGAWDRPAAQDGPRTALAASPSRASVLEPKAHMETPTPSLQAPVPAGRVPYPEPPVHHNNQGRARVEVEENAVHDEPEEEEEGLPEPLQLRRLQVEEGRARVEVAESAVHDETEEEEEGLPEPLQLRRLQVEEDFDHLLDHYSSFRSWPEAMSLEPLHLNGCNFSEELIGAAAQDAGAKDGSPQMLSEDDKTAHMSSTLSHLGEATVESQERSLLEIPPGKSQQPPRQISAMASSQGEQPILPKSAEESRTPAAVPKAPSRRWQKPVSSHSSMASVAHGAISDRPAQKSFRETNLAMPEEARILSPETDSGFVGSEASRVSPLAQVPRPRSSDLRPCSKLGKPDTALQRVPPRKQPAAMASWGMDVLPSPQKRSPPRALPFCTSSPLQWRRCLASELDPGTESSHADSEAEGDDMAATCTTTPPGEMKPSPASSAASLSPVQSCRSSFLDSCLQRDQAIVALQNEVSQLRQNLEETLRGPFAHPKQPSSPCATRFQRAFPGGSRICTSSALKGSDCFPGSTPSKTGISQHPASTVQPEAQAGRQLLPPAGSQQDASPSELDSSLPKPRKGRPRQASAPWTSPLNQSILRGPYTGAQYLLSAPKPREPAAPGKPTPCQDAPSRPREASAGEAGATESKGGSSSPRDVFRTARHSTRKKTKVLSCSLCNNARNPRSRTLHGEEDGRDNPPAQRSGVVTLGGHHQPQQPGLWYWAAPTPATSIGYISTVPLASYPLSPVIYCPPPAATSDSSPAGLPVSRSSRHQDTGQKAWTSWPRPRRGHHCSLSSDDDAREQDLNRALSRAVEAAKDMKLTTKRISRALSWELTNSRSLQGSCLF
ncbi:microtubule organization protein AKNA [Varanus komodoensis]|uniref:microtubule organization protein AKNA n=1 Tax=Varanus komodoensis TaxID=61221 RepID=UPI001CF7C31C|nr:microtubule organization protein AKNA [Varanus komodoensis]